MIITGDDAALARANRIVPPKSGGLVFNPPHHPDVAV
jgi:hypothetical protein